MVSFFAEMEVVLGIGSDGMKKCPKLSLCIYNLKIIL